jgi:hypothetical protein
MLGGGNSGRGGIRCSGSGTSPSSSTSESRRSVRTVHRRESRYEDRIETDFVSDRAEAIELRDKADGVGNNMELEPCVEKESTLDGDRSRVSMSRDMDIGLTASSPDRIGGSCSGEGNGTPSL